jgi:hypothetical protein
MDNLIIEKVTIKDKFTKIEYSTYTMSMDDELIRSKFVFTSQSTPHKDFVDCFQGLKKHAINICELSLFGEEKKALQQHIVTNVKMIEDDDNNDKVIISFNKYVKNGKCFSINTPLTVLSGDEYNNATELLAELEILKSEAIQYIKGKNGVQATQLDLFCLEPVEVV